MASRDRNIKPKFDVVGSTSLPPRVEGTRKGDVRISLQNLVWDFRGAPEQVAVRLKWWGEHGDGTTFSLSKNESETVVFAIHSGPKYLARYLKDMAQIVLYLADMEQTKLIGSVTIDIGFFDIHSPVSGTFPIVGQNRRAFGRVDVDVGIQYDTSLIDSFEINEHLASSDKMLPLLPKMGAGQTRRSSASTEDAGAAEPAETLAMKRQVVYVSPGQWHWCIGSSRCDVLHDLSLAKPTPQPFRRRSRSQFFRSDVPFRKLTSAM